MPRVTVITATYNWSTVLPFAIASVLEQTFTDFEMLVVGDGCTDESEQVVTAIKDPRVRWINIPRFGHQAGPNNEGLRQARGEYIAYLGHDDLWFPHHLEVLVAALEEVDVAHTIVASVFPDGSVLPKSVVPTCTGHRRSLTERIGGWRDYRKLHIAPERELWARMAQSGAKSVIVPRLTAVKIPAGRRRDVYRQRPSHEQEVWLARIRSEPELEVTMLGGWVLPMTGPETASARWARILRRPWEWPSMLWHRATRRKGQEIARVVRFKGVER